MTTDLPRGPYVLLPKYQAAVDAIRDGKDYREAAALYDLAPAQFAAVCAAVGMPPAKGKSRKLLTRAERLARAKQLQEAGQLEQ